MGATLLTVGVYVLLNYAANHVWAIPGGRVGYLLVVPVLAGIVLPAWAIVRLARGGRADLDDWGVRLRLRAAVGSAPEGRR